MITPQNFEEVVRLKKCYELYRILREPGESVMEQLFQHLAEPGAFVKLIRKPGGEDQLGFYNYNSDEERLIQVDVIGNILTATLTTSSFNTVYPQSHSGDGDSGSSGNNNNNNNNNNNA